ncbi:MAG TPA: patatin-like phospholipase family protein, partial [Burkholderiaceae bacterium]|nr:patatin-like phospholipase family protein [Burkholderiaceae bacterium]
MSDCARLAAGYPVVALVLQGGGALGAYQGGVVEALAEAGVEPNWVAGISIGALNA